MDQRRERRQTWWDGILGENDEKGRGRGEESRTQLMWDGLDVTRRFLLLFYLFSFILLKRHR